METIGVVVNPIAGMGGRVGLKGTDGMVEEARRRGADPRAHGRAVEALSALHRRRPDVRVLAAGGPMGADAAREAGFDPEVTYRPEATEWSETEAADTRRAVRTFLDRGVDLVVFVGGDGTAVDVARALEGAEAVESESAAAVPDERTADDDSSPAPTAAGDATPMLGVPAGVKVYSSVFAVTPADAGRIAAAFDRVERREVNDIDEAAYRDGEVRAELRAVVPVPVAQRVQSSKQLAGGSVDALAAGFAREIDPATTYVFGPGGTVGAIETELGIDPSPLGVDVWRDGEVLARDAAEADILAALDGSWAGRTLNESGTTAAGDATDASDGASTADSDDESDASETGTDTDAAEAGTDSGAGGTNGGDDQADPVVIVVSPIGGQGFIFGRGNHQLSPAVLRRATDVVVVASDEKLDGLDALRVDTDDERLDADLRGWKRVRTGRFTTRLIEVV